MSRRRVLALTALSLLALASPVAAPASAAPVPQRDVLSGQWQVTRTCAYGCAGSTSVHKTVHRRAGNVYVATGGPTQMLYRMGRQVLVHGPKDSSLLTIAMPGKLMKGSGVAQDGSTFTVEWRCTAAPKAASGVSQVRITGASAERPGVAPMALDIC